VKLHETSSWHLEFSDEVVVAAKVKLHEASSWHLEFGEEAP